MGLSVFTFTVRDRIVSMVVAAVALGLMLALAMAVYADIDLSFYYEMPQAILDAAGISQLVGGVGGIAYGAMYNLMGALTIGGLAIAAGSASIAGEERDGTIGLLLANPRSRTQVLLSKLAALVVLTTVGSLLLWVGGLAVPVALDIDVTGVQVGALVVHLWANSLFWGMLALALGAWTGRPSVAAGAAGGFMALSWLATSFLPMIDGGRTVAQFFPWWYFSSSAPEVNGVDAGHLAVLLGLTVALAVAAVVGVNRRDLRSNVTSVTLLDRLRENPRTAALADRIGGQARVSSIPVKTASDHQGLTLVVGASIAGLGLMEALLFTLLPDGISEVFEQFPDALIAMIGGVDMSTPSGFLQGEVFSIMMPIALIAVTGTVGAKALAGEEENGTMGLLLASPVRRSSIVLGKAVSMVALATVVGLLTFLGTAAGIALAGLDVSLVNLAAISLLATLLGLVFGAVALLVSAATGRVRWAISAAVGLALVAYMLQSFLPLSASYADWAALSPFHYFLRSDPLGTGMAWGDAGVLLAVFLVLVALAVPAFERRDLRG